ncbi:unnamed protein product [Coregonus sp. 'balchen']|nr:unnamed protein product [Coregonus sp. 'balchen']
MTYLSFRKGWFWSPVPLPGYSIGYNGPWLGRTIQSLLSGVRGVEPNATIGEIKSMFHKSHPQWYAARQSIRLDPKGKCLKDEDVLQHLPVGTTATFYFRDLGAQISWVTLGSWFGFTLMTQCLPVAFFTAVGFIQMTVWAKGKHRSYLKEFRDYPPLRSPILPFENGTPSPHPKPTLHWIGLTWNESPVPHPSPHPKPTLRWIGQEVGPVVPLTLHELDEVVGAVVPLEYRDLGQVHLGLGGHHLYQGDKITCYTRG